MHAENRTEAFPADALGENPNRGWRHAVAWSLYKTGVMRVMRSIARRYTWRPQRALAWPLLKRVRAPRFVILCYHRVGTTGVPLYSALPPRIFESQMRLLRKHYRVVSLDMLCLRLQDRDWSEPAVAVTFDDGYRDVYTHAFPILREYRIPATIFLTTGCIETGSVPWYDRVFLALQLLPEQALRIELDRLREFDLGSAQRRFRAALEIMTALRRLPEERRKQCCAYLERQVRLPDRELSDRMLTWEQVRAMRSWGISFGSHTVNHPVVSQLTSPEQLEDELSASKRLIEGRLQTPVESFAYPFGQHHDCGNNAREALIRLGYRCAATTIWGVNTSGTDPYALHRVQIGEERSLSLLAWKLNQLFLQGADPMTPVVPGMAREGSGLRPSATETKDTPCAI